MDEHVTLEIESIDRLYLNGYLPGLQTPAAVAYFLRTHRGARVSPRPCCRTRSERILPERSSASSRNATSLSTASARANARTWETQKRLLDLRATDEGISTSAPPRRRCGPSAQRSAATPPPERFSHGLGFDATAVVKVFYWYIVDEDFRAAVHQVRQLLPLPDEDLPQWQRIPGSGNWPRRASPLEALDNGVLHCAEPERAQAIANQALRQRPSAR